jgi:uncharacterized protein
VIFVGFDWDDGNRAKCLQHGVLLSEIEAVFERTGMCFDDVQHSQDEPRYRLLGPSGRGRMVFVVFTIRRLDGESRIRPISARFMHAKEVKAYEAAAAKLRF